MSRPCSVCESPHLREIDRRLRAGTPATDISAWLAAIDSPLHRTTIGRHSRHVADAVDRPRGPRPLSKDLLQAVVEDARDRLEAGEIRATLRDGISAQAELNRQGERQRDSDMMMKIALALTGNVAVARVIDPLETERLEIEAEFRALLPSGDEPYVEVPARHKRGADGRRIV